VKKAIAAKEELKAFRDFEVFDIRQESTNVKSFYLRPLHPGHGLVAYQAGES